MSTVSSIAAFQSTGTQGSLGVGDQMDKDTFLKLLVAQLRA